MTVFERQPHPAWAGEKLRELSCPCLPVVVPSASRISEATAKAGLFQPRTHFAPLRFAAVGALVAAITFLFVRLIPVNASTAGFAYLIAVLVASVLAVRCFNFFFFEPIGTFNFEDPQNWVALVAFLATAIMASELSSLARRRIEHLHLLAVGQIGGSAMNESRDLVVDDEAQIRRGMRATLAAASTKSEHLRILLVRNGTLPFSKLPDHPEVDNLS